jgi:hypothetical protein
MVIAKASSANIHVTVGLLQNNTPMITTLFDLDLHSKVTLRPSSFARANFYFSKKI